MENIGISSAQLITDSYQNYHHSVYLYILYKIGKDEDAKDLSQDVFLRLIDYKQILRPETVKFFIFSICRNLITDYLRRHYKTQEINAYLLEQLPTSTNNVESQIIANDISAFEQDRALRLPAQRRKIYVMNRFEYKSSADISANLGLSIRTVENHLLISRREIREYIQQCI